MSTEQPIATEMERISMKAENKTYNDLTMKQKNIVNVLAETPNLSNAEVAERAGCTDTHVYLTKKQYGRIIEEQRTRVKGGKNKQPRQKITDGGNNELLFDVIRAIREESKRNPDEYNDGRLFVCDLVLSLSNQE